MGVDGISWSSSGKDRFLEFGEALPVCGSDIACEAGQEWDNN